MTAAKEADMPIPVRGDDLAAIREVAPRMEKDPNYQPSHEDLLRLFRVVSRLADNFTFQQ